MSVAEPFVVDDLVFDLRWSDRRKTLEITVERDGALVVKAPDGTDTGLIEAFVREKKFWLYQKLAEKDVLTGPVASKEFVTGEGFPYLGRSYRLLLVDDQDVPLKLSGGRFALRRADTPEGRKHFVAWYVDRGRAWLRRRVGRWSSRMGLEPAGIEVRDLGFRWGSCGAAGTVNFHWATVLLPSSVIDYVIVHELAHLKEPNHTPEFWMRVERTMADYEVRKQWLAENGVGYAAM